MFEPLNISRDTFNYIQECIKIVGTHAFRVSKPSGVPFYENISLDSIDPSEYEKHSVGDYSSFKDLMNYFYNKSPNAIYVITWAESEDSLLDMKIIE
jgi:hypothetical protein